MVQTDNDESDINSEKISLESMDIAAEKRAALKQIFPEIFTEDKIDFNQFKRVLGEDIDVGKERFGLQWAGKADCFRVLQSPSIATLKPELVKSVNFDDTENLFIEGDNLEVLKLLQRSYFGKVKMIYIDPPYNTGREFIYPDKYQENLETYLQYSGQLDSDGHRFSTNTERTGRFHSNWLNMIYPRLYLARNLLRDDGVIFISIDDNEQANLKKLCDEIFGEKNFCGCFVINSTPNARDYGHIGKMHDYILMYAKNFANAKTYQIPEIEKSYKYNDALGGYNIHPLYNSNTAFHINNRPNLYYPFYIYPSKKIDNDFFSIGLKKEAGAIEIYPPLSQKEQVQFVWRWGKEKSEKELNKEIIGYATRDGEYRIVQKMRHSSKIIRSLLTDTSYSTRRGTSEVEKLLTDKVFSFPKPLSLLKELLTMSSSDGDLILDFFSGSCTTADAVMQLNAEDGGNRKYIMVQLPEPCDEKSEAFKAGYQNIADIGRERIRRAGKKIIDSRAEKAEAQAKQTTDMLAEKSHNAKLDTGFKSFKLTKSNFKIWQGDTEAMENPETDIVEQLEMHVDHLNPESTKEDILYELLLNQGIDMTTAIEKITIAGKEIFKIAQEQDVLLICLENQITQELIEAIADSNPQEIICLDKAFEGNDQLKTNAVHTFKTREHTHDQKIIFRTV